MCITIIDNIPADKYGKWLEIFKQVDGRFIRNPYKYPRNNPEFVRVECEFDDGDGYRELYTKYRLLTNPIRKSVRKPHMLHRLNNVIRRLYK
jgi:hypothetical protein